MCLWDICPIVVLLLHHHFCRSKSKSVIWQPCRMYSFPGIPLHPFPPIDRTAMYSRFQKKNIDITFRTNPVYVHQCYTLLHQKAHFELPDTDTECLGYRVFGLSKLYCTYVLVICYC